MSETGRLSTPLVRASIRGADTVPARSRGYDAGKRVNGRKRHLAVAVRRWGDVVEQAGQRRIRSTINAMTYAIPAIAPSAA